MSQLPIPPTPLLRHTHQSDYDNHAHHTWQKEAQATCPSAPARSALVAMSPAAVPQPIPPQNGQRRYSTTRPLKSARSVATQSMAPILQSVETLPISSTADVLGSTPNALRNKDKADSDFCYRHDPYVALNRQADGPSIEHLQHVSLALNVPR